ncbi:MAG: glycosyltransferase [Paracoccus sp.]|nr:glycosyltransferase [Paracoccus sp. (in: a-proteobacteria)]
MMPVSETAPAGPIAASVIVPVFRQWDMVRDLIAALGAQQPALPATVEVILVNNGDAAEASGLTLPEGFRLLHCDRPGSYAARNAGAAAASGVLLLFTDADCRPDPGWLAAHLAGFAAGGERLLAGPVRMECGPRPTLWARYDRLRGIPQAAYVARGYAATANLAVPRTIFRQLGGFSTTHMSGGDAEFCHRARAAGYGIDLLENAVVAHPCRESGAETIRKSRRVKGGQLPQGRAARLAWLGRSALPPILTSGSVLRRPFGLGDRLAALLVVWLLWAVDLAEALRLVLGGRPERR